MPGIKQEYENQKKFLDNSINSLRKRLEIESQIHKADTIQIMTSNIDLIDKITYLRDNIKKLESARTESENKYKQMCTKFGIQQAKTLDDLDDENWQRSNQHVLRNVRNPVRHNDEEGMQQLRGRREDLRTHIEMLKHNLEDIGQEQMQLEEILQEQ